MSVKLSGPIVLRAVPSQPKPAAIKLVGCSEEYLELNQLEIDRGRWLTARDRGKKVVVSADETATIVETLLTKYHDREDYAVVVPKELLRQAAYMDPIEALGHE